jgi:hypothetical protein
MTCYTRDRNSSTATEAPTDTGITQKWEITLSLAFDAASDANEDAFLAALADALYRDIHNRSLLELSEWRSEPQPNAA